MTFDTQRALAELEQSAILLSHHVRQAQIACDVETLRIFAKKFYDLQAHADQARRSMPRTCAFCNKTVTLKHIKLCPQCHRNL